MQKESSVNESFIEDYHHVLVHHVDCILKSRMILDEDMRLIMTFWDPNLYSKKSNRKQITVTYATCATIGMVASMKFRNLYPFAILLAPTAFMVCQKMKSCYFERTYKRNFERLLNLICELYELISRNIMEYYHKRDMAVQVCKIPSEAYNLLLRPGEEFLKRTVLLVVGVLEEIRSSMLQISELVPLSEGGYIYSVNSNFEDLKSPGCSDFKELQHQFQKISDFYVLGVSNFLSCIGLSFCSQLWKESSCSFKKIFNKIIPGLCRFLESSVSEIKVLFDQIRFTLHDVEDKKPRAKHRGNNKSTKGRLPLQQPLAEVLTDVQIMFETTKQLQILLDRDDSSIEALENITPLVEDVGNQFAMCDDSWNTFLKSFCLLTKRSSIKKIDSSLMSVAKHSTASAEIHYDDPLQLLQDEEYNLSIHGSDDEGSITVNYDYADQCSTEHLELMLNELKKKLRERKAGRNKLQDSQEINVPKKVSFDPSERPLPPPPPPCQFPDNLNNIPASTSAIDRLPIENYSHANFLDAVKSVAQKLNRDEEFQFGFNMFPEIPRPFNTTYRCFSVAMLPGNERQDVERGGKIIMPPSALEQLTRLNINYPMLFKIVNKKTTRITHCGVLEFVADEGKVYLPLWMMHNLVLEEGDLIQIESVSLPVGTFAKFQPLSPEFLDITNPKAVLENCLRTYACLTSGDVIAVKYNQRAYELCVLETQPGNAISIIECDMNVEFAAPVGYKEHEVVKHPEEEMSVDPADLMPEPSGFVAFRGTGNRLDGKRRKDSGPSESSTPKPVYVRGIPDYDYEIGTLKFLRHITKSPTSNKEENGEFKAFSGEGFSLKRRT